MDETPFFLRVFSDSSLRLVALDIKTVKHSLVALDIKTILEVKAHQEVSVTHFFKKKNLSF